MLIPIWERRIDEREIRARIELEAMLRDGIPRRRALHFLGVLGLTSFLHPTYLNSVASANPGLIPAIISRLRVSAVVQVNSPIAAEFALRNETNVVQQKPAVAQHEDPTGRIVASENILAEVPPMTARAYNHSRFVARQANFGRNEYHLATAIDNKTAGFGVT